MSEVWLTLKNSLHYCKPHSTEVHDPKTSRRQHHRKKKTQSKVIEGSNSEKQHSGGDGAILDPVTHEIFLDDASEKIKIKTCLSYSYTYINNTREDGANKGLEESSNRSTKRNMSSTKTQYVDCYQCSGFLRPRVSMHKDSNSVPLTSKCHHHHQCRDKQKKCVEGHGIVENSVVQLHREDSSWKIIERICETKYMNPQTTETNEAAHIECVLKVLTTPQTLASFEECRERVRNIAENMQPRCIADGNEVMRFYGTTIACSLGLVNYSSTLSCTLEQCGLCQILKHGFNANQEFHGERGVLTTATSDQAFDSIILFESTEYDQEALPILRKCVIVCRVIAGRVHNPLQEIQEETDLGFDSLIKKINRDSSDIEELCILNPRAILPCFVVIYNAMLRRSNF
ncbi:uncharacterized protein LOC130966610 [Arachis stenosperma]|uniref:uncharacterized protein LOC130966610 n=1 Tax=Arachis stenosperma TaxID=217475 RepID=UPI0025ABF064|nr:uncharacterized protein LOC130966610 [Arachis stenosperma]